MAGRRLLSAFVLLTIVVAQGFVCGPVAATSSSHCTSQVKAAAHDCCQPADRIDCCAAPDRNAPALPSPAQCGPTRHSAGLVQLQVVHTAAAVVPVNVSMPGDVLRSAPVHGYRTTDLPILHAVFLL